MAALLCRTARKRVACRSTVHTVQKLPQTIRTNSFASPSPAVCCPGLGVPMYRPQESVQFPMACHPIEHKKSSWWSSKQASKWREPLLHRLKDRRVQRQQRSTRLRSVLKKYGWVALGFHSAVYTVTLTSTYCAIMSGADVDSWIVWSGLEGLPGEASGLALAYGVTALTGPARGILTVAATPSIAKWLQTRGFRFTTESSGCENTEQPSPAARDVTRQPRTER